MDALTNDDLEVLIGDSRRMLAMLEQRVAANPDSRGMRINARSVAKRLRLLEEELAKRTQETPKDR